jgi:hypothetical protein
MVICSCSKDDPIIPNEEELITTVTYTLTPNDGGQAVVFSFQDLDGDGGNEPIIQNAILSSGTTYSGTLELLNEVEDPVEDITDEVREEGADHQFFFQISNGSNLSIDYNDSDVGGFPIGIETIVTTGEPQANGGLTIVLKHEPEKDASGVQSGDIANAGGETDIQVNFEFSIQ